MVRRFNREGRILRDNKLMQLFSYRDAAGNYHFIRHGKRVSSACPLSRAEIRIYVEEGGVRALAYIARTRGLSFYESVKLLDLARYGTDDKKKIEELKRSGAFK